MLDLWARRSSCEHYRKLLEEGSLDRSGVTLLAGAVASATAATIVIAGVLRLHHGGPITQPIDLNLIDPGPSQDDREALRLLG